jgi:hypothetical protein
MNILISKEIRDLVIKLHDQVLAKKQAEYSKYQLLQTIKSKVDNAFKIEKEANLKANIKKAISYMSIGKDKPCLHKWKHGYILDLIVFCERCESEAGQVYKGMPYKDQCKLVSKS